MRIIRSCREMGIDTVLVYSSEDSETLPVQLADEAVCIGPAQAQLSYLSQDAILQTALSYECEAIHPGYGFLSENADFAAGCEDAGIRFIGPSSDRIKLLGDKNLARELMKKNGVPVVPGSDGLVGDTDEACSVAESIGYPVLIKAAAGGGGRGMRIAESAADIRSAFESARAEAVSAFGNGDMYIEKYITSPRHIEVQLLGDRHGNLIHLGERDCSLQRRRQKMVEEAPAGNISESVREGLYEAAVKAGKAAGYDSAGTAEFVLDRDGNFYFIEMNTRIQVEHPVTEMVSGVDIVKEQIKAAAGVPLSYKQSDIHISGHAIECRINAEDPAKGFMPSPGKIDFIHFPCGAGVRIESALFNGGRVSPYYDSMMGKIIVHATGRLEAIRRMRMALAEFTVEGVKTNSDFLYLLMFDPEYLKGNFTTDFIDANLNKLLGWERDAKAIDEEDNG